MKCNITSAQTWFNLPFLKPENNLDKQQQTSSKNKRIE